MATPLSGIQLSNASFTINVLDVVGREFIIVPITVTNLEKMIKVNHEMTRSGSNKI